MRRRDGASARWVARRKDVRPDVPGSENELGERPDQADSEAAWDELYKHSRRTQERFHRFFEERMARGEDYDTAFDGALQDAGLVNPDGDENGVERDFELPDDPQFWASAESDAMAEAEADSDPAPEQDGDEGEPDFPEDERHPLLKQASQFYLRLHELFKDEPDGMKGILKRCSRSRRPVRRAGIMALSIGDDLEDDFGLSIVQFKRALRGVAFIRGSLYNVPKGSISKRDYESLKKTLDEIEEEAFQELGRARETP